MSSSLGALIFFLKQQSRSVVFKAKLHLCRYCSCFFPCLSDVTGVDFIPVRKGSPTLESPRRQLRLVSAMVTTTNKGQSPMVMANWVCSRYWPSELWSTDGELASLTQVTLQPSVSRHCCVILLIFSLSLCWPVHYSNMHSSFIRRTVTVESQECCQ